MTSVEIAVSLPGRLVDRARRQVKAGAADSVSAYVAGALEQRAQLEDLETLLDEMLRETGGAMTAAERRAADAVLGVTSTTAPRGTRSSRHR
jgi:Arc/MetJ-type ribon-helix-helix transcriptional regulator